MDGNWLAVDTYDKIADVYTQQYFNDLSDAPWIDKFLHYLPPQAKILDVGCGPGEFTRYILDKNFDITGVDLSRAMIDIARERVGKEYFAIMDMCDLDYQPSTFDGLLAAYSLIHIPSSKVPHTLAGFYRILKPCGCLMIITQHGKPDRVVDEPLMAGEKMFINFFTGQRIASLLRAAGFTIIHQEELAIDDPDALSDRVIYTMARR